MIVHILKFYLQIVIIYQLELDLEFTFTILFFFNIFNNYF